MPNKYTVSKRADKNIGDILEYSYRNFGLSQTLKYKQGLDDCFQLLADNPDMGRTCNDIRQGYHRHEHECHIIFYRKRKLDIFIAAIIHDSVNIKYI